MSGCDEEAVRVAREAADRQAEQNTAMAELNKEVAGGTRRLAEADAQARKEVIGVHRDLQAERARLDSGWDDLEQERRQIAGQRRTESMLVPATKIVGGLALAIVLLGFCWYALVAMRRGDNIDGELNELLICEVLADESPLLSSDQHPPSLLGHSQSVGQPTD
jgi:hypothetical protein